MAYTPYRRGPSRNLGASPGFSEIRNFFNFRSIRLGSWVKDSERQIAAGNFFIALLDLQEILGVPTEVISLRGQLSLHYGAGGRPGVSAHYQPSARVLALAKNAGAGSLAHEWFHAFDHYVAQHLFAANVGERFATTAWLADFPVKSHPLCTALTALYKGVFLDETNQKASSLVERSVRADRKNGQLYWSRPEEIGARAFESFIEDATLRNSFLASGTLPENDSLGVYPNRLEREAISPLFERYFRLLGQYVATNPQNS